jgi:outer membrane protease
MIISLYANDDYIPISKIPKDVQEKYNFIKPSNIVNDEKERLIEKPIDPYIIKKDLILKDEIKENTSIKTKENTIKKINPLIDNPKIKLNVSMSNFNSNSEQYIYYAPTGQKISQLTWEAKNVELLGLGIEYKIRDVGIFLNYKTNNKNGDGLMDDYDWVYEPEPDTWTHWSHHENTVVEDINILDLGISKEFNIYQKTKLIMSLGYKWEKQLFKAYDGTYIYSGSDLPSEFRAYTGTFNGKGITYKQEYNGFYIGADLEKEYKDFDFLVNVKYTPKMNVEFTDTHHMRNPSFTDYTSFDETSMLSLGLGINYNINVNQMLSFYYDYTKYSYIRGDRVRSYVIGYNWQLPESVGVESENNMISLQYTYKFLNIF